MRIAASLFVLACASCASPPPPALPTPPDPPAASHAAAPPVAHPDVTNTFETVKVGDGIYAFLAPEGRSGIVNSNSIAIVGDDGVLVVDTTAFQASARLEIAALRTLTDQPVRTVVTTHWHQDHLRGNLAYRAAFPGVTFLCQEETKRLLFVHDPKNIADMKTEYPAYGVQIREALKRGTHRDGKPLTDEERAELTAQAEDIEAATGDWKLAETVPPTATFTDETTIHLGKRVVKVMHLGRGNTAGDTVVYVPDAKVLATGDLLVSPTPYGHGAYPTEWIATLKKLEAIDATTIVPGHGPVQHDFTYAKRVEGALASMIEQARAAVKKGQSLADARKALDLRDIKAQFVAGGGPARSRAWDDFFVEEAFERAYQEAQGKLAPE